MIDQKKKKINGGYRARDVNEKTVSDVEGQ